LNTEVMATDKGRLTTYVPTEIKKYIEDMATSQRRTLSNMLEIIIIEYVESHQQKTKQKGDDRNG
jgi:hypothetical protein